MIKILYNPVPEKTNNSGSETSQYSHRRWIEAGNFGFRKLRNFTIRVAKTKALISFAVTAKLICVFVFAYADFWFSHAVLILVHFCDHDKSDIDHNGLIDWIEGV